MIFPIDIYIYIYTINIRLGFPIGNLNIGLGFPIGNLKMLFYKLKEQNTSSDFRALFSH